MRTPERLWPVTAVPILLFVLITWQVMADGPLLRVDERVSRALVHPDRVSAALSDLGDVQVAVPVLAVAIGLVLWLGRRDGADRWWLPPVAAAVLMALVPAIVVPLKAWTDRPGTPVMPWAGGFYPSGHTATAAVAYGAATLILLPWLVTALARRLLVAVCAVVNLGVGFGLIRRGYHWPLDVVASWCLCSVLLFALWVFLSRSTRRSSSGTPSWRTGPS
ncbi:phosphatase PAP2 family protein [Streptomyces sp. NPDC054833]